MATQHSPCAFDTLSAKELEILRLLAAGHTVKSIAVQLGRSEASINERLREARRKTSVGSSRELARLIDAQKNWDKIIDLSAPAFATDNQTQPQTAGLNRSKGMTMLIIAMPLAALGLAIAAINPLQDAASAPMAHAAAPKQTSLVGTWSLDVARIPAEERPRAVTIEFRVAPDGKWITHVRIVSADGSEQHAESSAAPDGHAVPLSGNMAFIDSTSLRQPAPGTLVMTLSKNGSPVSTRVYTASKDGKSMTETIVWAGQDVPKLETTYFNRVN